jgi:DNA-directed RNA polymerase specialized sigma24 family protein
MDRRIDEEEWIPVAGIIWKALDQGFLKVNKQNYLLMENLYHQFGYTKSMLCNDILLYYFEKDLDKRFNKDLSKVETWLNQIIYRYLSSLWRNLQRAKKKDVLHNAVSLHPTCCKADASEDEIPFFDWTAFETDTPETLFLAKERQTIINDLFDEIDQQVLYNEISMAEGAKLKQKKYDTYKKELSRKKKQLRKMLEE